MKLMILTTHYPPPFSGASVRIWYLTKFLSQMKYYVDKIFVVELSRKIMQPKKFFGSEYIFTARNGILRNIRLAGLNDLGYVLRGIKPQLVIATNPPSTAIDIAVKTYSKDNIPILCDVQDVTDEYKVSFTNKLLAGLYRAYYYTKLYKNLKKCARVYTVTEIMGEIIKYKSNVSPYIAPNGSDPELYRDAYLKYKDKVACKPYCTGVFVGSLDWEYQKIESIIKAIGILRKDYNLKVGLKIIGTGKLLGYYIKTAKKYNVTDLVKFYGYVTLSELPYLIASSDFGIIGRPSTRNAWIMSSIRMTIYDYLAAGIPVLAYGPLYSYTRLFITKNKIGLYIPSDKPENIANFINEKISSILSIKRKHCRNVAERYSWKHTLSPIIEYIKDIFENK